MTIGYQVSVRRELKSMDSGRNLAFQTAKKAATI